MNFDENDRKGKYISLENMLPPIENEAGESCFYSGVVVY